MFSKEQFTTVTPLSKALAMGVLIILPFIAFFLGMNFGKQSVPPVTTEFVTTANKIGEIDTSDWKTYTNEEFGYEFRYPNNLLLTEKVFNEEDEKPLKQYVRIVDQAQDRSLEWSLHVNVEPNPWIYTLEEWDKILGPPYLVEEYTPNKVTLGSIEAIRNKTSGSDSIRDELIFYESVQLLALYNNRFYEIFYITDDLSDPRIDEYKEISEQILSTFRFIGPVDISNWQIYSNEKIGFSLIYPDSWSVSEEGASYLLWAEFLSPDYKTEIIRGVEHIVAGERLVVSVKESGFANTAELFEYRQNDSVISENISLSYFNGHEAVLNQELTIVDRTLKDFAVIVGSSEYGVTIYPHADYSSDLGRIIASIGFYLR